MANITRHVHVPLMPQAAWEAVRDVGQAHERLFPRLLTGTTMEEGARIVTFSNGLVLRELILDIDDTRMRMAYASVGGRSTHHNSSMQVLPAGDGQSCIIWITDFLPHELMPLISSLVDAGVADIRQTLVAPAA